MRWHGSRGFSHKMKYRHPLQLKKPKSWEPFWSYQLNKQHCRFGQFGPKKYEFYRLSVSPLYNLLAEIAFFIIGCSRTTRFGKITQWKKCLSNVLNTGKSDFDERNGQEMFNWSEVHSLTYFMAMEHISPYYVMIYNSKTSIGILNNDLDSRLKLEF